MDTPWEGWDAPRLARGPVVLEPLRVDDAGRMWEVLADPRLYAFIQEEPPTRDALRARYARQARGRSPDGRQRWLNWVVCDRDTGAAAGYVQATVAATPGGPGAELAWVIGVRFQGRGFATAAAAAMAGWLGSRGVRRLTAHIHPDNLASGRVAARLGLAPTGRVEAGEVLWVAAAPPHVTRERLEMTVSFNHTIVPARDRRASAAFLAGLLGLPEPTEWGPFSTVALPDGVFLQFAEPDVAEIQMHHYAFLVDDATFDACYARLRDAGVAHWADPGQTMPGQVNTNHGGRGVYFFDPSGHGLEVLTRPYGAGG
ncbi:MAG TPA: GNAT family N-acetyltransferase [Thermomicrobiaceae bacterium]|nr:GNAT family N-acetyltransferase [Thermomicrobiaceae bacterium]